MNTGSDDRDDTDRQQTQRKALKATERAFSRRQNFFLQRGYKIVIQITSNYLIKTCVRLFRRMFCHSQSVQYKLLGRFAHLTLANFYYSFSFQLLFDFPVYQFAPDIFHNKETKNSAPSNEPNC